MNQFLHSMIRLLKKQQLFKLIVFLFILGSCGSERMPSLKNGLTIVKNHFAQEAYGGLIAVQDAELISSQDYNYEDSRFYELDMKVRVRIAEDYVVSRFFFYRNFEVNTQWPQMRAEALANSPTQQDSLEVIDVYNRNLFLAGEHLLFARITFVHTSDKWAIFDMLFDEYHESTADQD